MATLKQFLADASPSEIRYTAATKTQRSTTARMRMDALTRDDPQMTYNARCASRVMNKRVMILLSGETGTGKEAFARAVHDASERAAENFVALNCAAIPETLVESELFGYQHGAFTGARRDGMQGRITESSGGTLFLDEIGDMPCHLQTRLLRVLEDSELRPLGSTSSVHVDLHVISATNRDLSGLVETGEFRKDLYYRLNALVLHLPPLRDRKDLMALIETFLVTENDNAQDLRLEQAALDRLLRYSWPGNIRELRNVLRTAIALSDGRMVRIEDLPKHVTDGSSKRCGVNRESPQQNAGEADHSHTNYTPLETAEREIILATLKNCRWNVTTTAQTLRLSRSTLYRKAKRLGIELVL